MDPLRWTDKVNALSTLVTAMAAVFVPIGAFFWLNPAVQDARSRKQLTISEATCAEFCGGDNLTGGPEIIWTIHNPSELYADDVVIEATSLDPHENRVLKLCDSDNPVPDFCVKLSRDYLADASAEKNVLTIRLKASIPPRSPMEVFFFIKPDEQFDDRSIKLLVNSKNGPAQELSEDRGGNW